MSKPDGPEEAQPPSKPASLVAALLVGVLLGPGAGHFLAGKLRRGLAFALASMSLVVVASFAVARAPSVTTACLYALPVLVHLASLVDLVRLRSRFEPKRIGRFLMQVIALLIAGVTLRGAMRTHVIEMFQLPSGSMIPTLMVGDYFFVAKVGEPPTVGDVVAFPSPEKSEVAAVLVKRIVAGPGQRVEQRGGSLLIDGALVPRCAVGEVVIDGKSRAFFLERQGDRRYLVVEEGPPARDGSWTVADGEVFVLGDNRSNSHDSRSWFEGKGGGVRKDQLLGRATFRVLRGGAIGFGHVGDVTLPPGAEALQGGLGACLASE